MKKRIALLLLFSLFFGLFSACGLPTAEGNESQSKSDTPDIIRPVKPSFEPTGQPSVFVDAENLLEVSLRKGEVFVSFNMERWEELFHLSELDCEFGIYHDEYKVTDLSGPVKDVCIAPIRGLSFLNGEQAETPIVFLLIEDGTAEWFPSEMISYNPEDPILYSMGTLPFLKDIAFLSYGSSYEGQGGMTVFAEDSNGVFYDVYTSVRFIDLYSGPWFADVYADSPFYNSGYYCVLEFFPDGSVSFQKGWIMEGPPQVFTGTFHLSIAEDYEQKLGILTLDLYNADEASPQSEIHGEFFADVQGWAQLELYYSSGDFLYTEDTEDYEYALFYLGYNPFGADPRNDYINYLTTYSQKAREYMYDYGMSAWLSGDYVEINGDSCRIIWLGTDHEDQFVREVIFAISDFGVIYEYDTLEDRWEFAG